MQRATTADRGESQVAYEGKKILQEVGKGADPDRFADPGVLRSLRFAPKQSSSIPPMGSHANGTAEARPSVSFVLGQKSSNQTEENKHRAGLQLGIVSFSFSSSVSIGSVANGKRSEKSTQRHN